MLRMLSAALAFLLVIPSGAPAMRYAKATDSSATFDLPRNLQFGVGTFRVWFASANYLIDLHPRTLFVSITVTLCGL